MGKAVSYNDGKTALRRKVLAEVSGDDLVLTDQAFREIARWPLADIRYVDPGHRRPPIRLRLAGSDARLSLDGGDDGGWLTHKCPNLTKRDTGAVKWPTWVAAGVLAVASLAGIFVYLLPAASSTIVGLVPPGMEQNIGRESRDQLMALLGRARVALPRPLLPPLQARHHQPGVHQRTAAFATVCGPWSSCWARAWP